MEYILAIELLSAYEAQPFMNSIYKKSGAAEAIFTKISETVPLLKEDEFLYPHIETLRELIHQGILIDLAEAASGPLEQ